ncbi:MAG: hypothetical protein WCF84_15650, partial [Anaerolineae bacterium]
EFWKTVTMDKANLLEQVLTLLNEHGIRYCVIGGVGVNAYVEPLVTLDLDLVVAVAQLEQVASLLAEQFGVKRFPHSLNVSLPGSELRVQIQTDPRYSQFVERAARREVLDLIMPVADVKDLLQGKIWAAEDPERRRSKRRKDLLDIERLIEAFPSLRADIPPAILQQLDQLGG